MDFRVNVKSTVRVRLPGFTDDQMRHFGEVAIDVQKDRVLAGINVADGPAKPLRPGYVKQKRRRGQPAIRNMRFTGALLDSLRVTSATNGRVRVGVGPGQAIKAHTAQERERMLGLSPNDKREVFQEMRREFGNNVKNAFRK